MDKIRKVLELIDNPGEYSPEEMEGILSDPEMRRLYDTLSATSGALHASEVDVDRESVDREWRRFSQSHRRSVWHTLWHQRRAAMIAGVVATSLLAVGMGVGLTVYNGRPAPADPVSQEAQCITGQTAAEVGDTSAVAAPLAEVLPPTVEFEDETLETIIGQIASRHSLEARFLSSQSKGIRLYFVWDTTQPVEETIASLDNFERFSVFLQDATIIVK